MKIHIEKCVYGGLGMGHSDGKIIFVHHALPGETVLVNIEVDKGDYASGSIHEVLQASDSRMTPLCPNFGLCGGCSYLNTTYENELTIKQNIIRDTLIRTGGLDISSIPDLMTVSSERFMYRSHATIKIKDHQQGFYRKGSNEIIPFKKSCLLLSDPINRRLEIQNMAGDEIKIAADAEGTICCSADEEEHVIKEKEHDITYSRGIRQFYQANRFLRPRMLETVARYAELDKAKSFLDICCGIGFFSLYLSRFAASGHGFDIDREAISWARKNRLQNSIGNIDFHHIPASDIRPARFKADVIIIDPPRSGLDRKARRTISALRPRTIVYISCNPATFSRDLRDFRKAGYILENLTFMDMFPGTHHIEIISRLVSS